VQNYILGIRIMILEIGLLEEEHLEKWN